MCYWPPLKKRKREDCWGRRIGYTEYAGDNRGKLNSLRTSTGPPMFHIKQSTKMTIESTLLPYIVY